MTPAQLSKYIDATIASLEPELRRKRSRTDIASDLPSIDLENNNNTLILSPVATSQAASGSTPALPATGLT